MSAEIVNSAEETTARLDESGYPIPSAGKRRLYVASSWRNSLQPEIVGLLRDDGNAVYDFRNPFDGGNGFKWSEIDPNWKSWDRWDYRDFLDHEIAELGFKNDWDAMQWADTGVLLLPSGRSAHLEAGYFVGAGKELHILIPNEDEFVPELMYKMATRVHCSDLSLLCGLQKGG
jgi:hypothetical protein